MKAQILTTSLLALLFLAVNSGARGQETKKKIKVYDLGSSNFTGDQIRGPRTVRADNLNVLRYSYRFSNTITFSQPVDLWSKLQATAVPSTTTPPAQLTPPKAPQPFKAPGDVLSKTTELIDQAKKLVAKGEKAIEDANSAISVASGTTSPAADSDCQAIVPVDLNVTKETNRQSACLANEVAAETLAITQVKSAGQSLISLLQRSGSPPELLMANINQAVTAQSFMQGINASWPNFDGTETLRRSAEGWKIELGDRKAKFNGDVPKISGAMTAANTDLSDIKEKLLVEASNNTGNDQQALTNEAAEVQDTMTRLDNALKELTKTSNLLDWAIGENQRVLGVIPDLEPSSSKYTDFQTAREALITWQTRMTDLQKRWADYQVGLKNGKSEEENPNPFSLSTSADCEFAFSRTKTTAVVLTRTDLMPGTTATGPETVLSLTVECTSPFTISAGVAFSTIGQHQFAIQPTSATPPATGTVNTFVATDTSDFHPLPLGMIHARLYEFSDTVALHASFGMAGNFQSQSAGGSSAGFLIGPSFSLFRTMFLTPGLYIGEKAGIGAGFRVNELVPSNITTVPLETSYTTGFGFAITFTKP